MMAQSWTLIVDIVETLLSALVGVARLSQMSLSHLSTSETSLQSQFRSFRGAFVRSLFATPTLPKDPPT
jgi:hypothetical protein